MRRLNSATIALLLGTCFVPTIPSVVWAQTCTCAGAGIRSDVAPPPLPEYDQPPVPAPGYMWTPGYWAWNNYDYYWVPGTWVEPPQTGLLWTPGYWGVVDGVYAFNPGYWGSHVGFYGGVSYGFGYGGVGYEGGHWDNGAFFYNRAVNHIVNASIVNIYNKTVVVDNSAASRASFNGPGGIAAKPTAEEEAAAKEPHVNPTGPQVDHARTASMKTDLFVSTNHGKPAIAATVKPAAFTGAGVVKAKAAGLAPIRPAGAEAPAAVQPKEEKKAPEGSDLKRPAKTTPEVEPKAEKKAPEGGDLKAEPKKSPAAEPAAEPKKSPAAEPVAEPKKSPAAEPAEHKLPAAEPEKRLPPSAAEKKAPAGGANADHAPPAHAPAKEKCGGAGEPKCP